MTPRPGWAREAEAQIAGEQDSSGALTAWVEVVENRGHDGGGMTAWPGPGSWWRRSSRRPTTWNRLTGDLLTALPEDHATASDTGPMDIEAVIAELGGRYTTAGAAIIERVLP